MDIGMVFKPLLQCPAIDTQLQLCGKQVASLNCLFILPYLYYIVNLLVYLFICQLMSASLSAVRCPALVHC